MTKSNMTNFLKAFITLLSCGLLQSCSNSKTAEVTPIFPTHVTVSGNKFVDDFGRQVILNSINVVNKTKADDYMFKSGPEFYANLKKWGFNSIRFIIIWDGLEPQPGVYNEDYLKEIDKRIKWAGDNGIFVVLDMHQDLYSVKYSDGAPAWATLDEGKPHITGKVWSDAYMISPAVQTSFDNFWANKKAADSVGVQDHFVALWKHIASRYAKNPTVIGYDLLNEPFPGTVGAQSMPALFKAYGELVYRLQGKMMTEKEIVDTWSDHEKRATALEILSNKENFALVIDVLQPFSKSFETEQLQPMYQKVSSAIRKVDSTTPIFLEHAYYGNMGVRSSIERTTLSDGKPDPLVAYAPHGYDLVTDTKNAANASSNRVDFIYNRLREKGEELRMPVWLGEWGAFYNFGEEIVPVAKNSIDQIEKNLFGNAYWSYDPGMEKQAYFEKAIIRPYTAYINGNLLSYHFDGTSQFTAEWQEDKSVSAPTTIFIPWLSRLDTKLIQEDFKIRVEKIDGSDAGWIAIDPTGKSEKRRLELSFSK